MIVSGYASTPDLDGHGHRILPRAFSLKHLPPLLWRHKWHLIAGEVTELEYRNDKLWCVAKVKPEYEGRAKGFSIGFKILEQEQKSDHIEIRKGILASISLVLNPCCPGAVITNEYPDCAAGEFLGLMSQRVRKIEEITRCLAKI